MAKEDAFRIVLLERIYRNLNDANRCGDDFASYNKSLAFKLWDHSTKAVDLYRLMMRGRGDPETALEYQFRVRALNDMRYVVDDHLQNPTSARFLMRAR
jgi:hypothetical protein